MTTKSGAPLENRNALRHGLTASRLPRGAGYIARDTEALRRVLEDAVAELNNGDVSLYAGALINSAIRWERHALLCGRWLRHEADQMDHQARLTFSQAVAKASSERDKCLKLLGLDKTRRQSVIDALYSAAEPQDEDSE